MRRFPQRLWWIEPRQNIHYDVVEGDVRHTTSDMLDRKYRQYYRMGFMTFEYLISELIPFLQPTAETFVRPPIPVKKQVALVIFRLAHGYSCKAMNNLYSCRESTHLLFVEYFRVRMDCLRGTSMHLGGIDWQTSSAGSETLLVCH
jgi:hypothetical protein